MHVRCIHPSSSYSGSLSAGPTRSHGTKLPREQKLPVCEAARIAAYRHDPEREYDEVLDSAGGGASRQVLAPPSRFTTRSSIVPIQHVPGSSVRHGSPSSNGTHSSGDASANEGPVADNLEQQQQQQKQLQNGREAHQDLQNASHQQALLAPASHNPVPDPSPPSSNGSTHSHASTQHAQIAPSTAQGITAPAMAHTSPPLMRTPSVRSPSASQPQEPFIDPSSPQQHGVSEGGACKRGNEDSQHMGALCHVLDELERLVYAPASGHQVSSQQGQPRPASADVHLKLQAQAPDSSTKRGSAPSVLLRSNTFPPFPQHQQQQKRRQLLHTIVCCHSVSKLQHLLACNEQQLDVRHVVAMAKRLGQLHLAHNTSLQHPPGSAAGLTSPSQERTPSSPSSPKLHSTAAGVAGNVGASSISSAAEPTAPRNGVAAGTLQPSVAVKTSFQTFSSPRSRDSGLGTTGRGSSMPHTQQAGSTAAAAAAPRAFPLQQAEPVALQLWGTLLDKMMFLTPLVSVQQAADLLQAMSVVRPIADAVMEVHAARDRARTLDIKRRRRQRERELEQQEQDDGSRSPARQGQSQRGVPGQRGGALQAGGVVSAQPLEQHVPSSVSGHFPGAHSEAVAAASARAAAPGDGQSSGDSSSNEAYSSSSSSSSASQVRQASLVTLPLPLPRTLTSKQRQQLAEGLLLHTQHKLRSASPAVLTQMLHAVSKLGVQPPASWLAAYWEASGPRLAQHSTDQLLSVCQALGHLGAPPPQQWMMSFFAATRPCLRGLHVVGISKLVHGLARLPVRPGQSWMGELLLACEGQLDELDAPAYALLVHGLGCMGHVPPRGWLDELLESAASLMHDFSPEELSLLLRGLAYMDVRPHPSLASHIWASTEPKLPSATGPQLSNIGWAAMALLSLRPPRSWVSAWLNALARASSPVAATAPAAAAAAVMNHGGGDALSARAAQGAGQQQLPPWQPLRRTHAKRAAEALAALGVPQLDTWCARLGVPTPVVEEEPEEEGPDAVALAARAARARANSSTLGRSPSDPASAFASMQHPLQPQQQRQRAASPRPRLWSEPAGSDGAPEEEHELLQGKQAGAGVHVGQGSPTLKEDGIISEQAEMQSASSASSDGSSVAIGRQ